MLMENLVLPDGCEIRSMSGEDFAPLYEVHHESVFDESQLIFRALDAFSDVEKEKISVLRTSIKDAIRIRLGLYHKNEFIGWSWGFQETAETFYMCNSAVLEPHRRKGLYTQLAKRMVLLAEERGFQKIYSRHTATNNSVIIAKLKLGFHITSLEMSDTFGVLVHLSYLPNCKRRKVLNFRAGQARPDEEVRRLLKL
jgi:hypothetical protein